MRKLFPFFIVLYLVSLNSGCKKDDGGSNVELDGFDCVNGNCESVENSPMYASLSECQNSCMESVVSNESTFTDTRDGQVYSTMKIGNDIWFTENLNFEVANSWCFANNPDNCKTYGRMYDWETAMIACPVGWHLPSDKEWYDLEKIVDPTIDSTSIDWRGLDAGIKLKSNMYWRDNGNGTDDFSFRGLPAGWYDTNNVIFMDRGKYGFWWSSTESSSSEAYRRGLSNYSDQINRISYSKSRVYSVRCVKD